MPSRRLHGNLNVDDVTDLIAEVARDIVMPRFGVLRADEIHHKDTPGYMDDLVTIVDGEAEDALTRGLQRIVAAEVIGEEAAHEHGELLSRVHANGPIWIVDPLDGTHNFAAGHDGFGIMVAFVVDGQLEAGWVHLPARGETFVGVAGDGAYLNGERISAPETVPVGPPRGSLFVRFMPPDLRERVVTRTRGAYEDAAHAGAAAVEYMDVLRGRKDFVVYYRLLPWDHGAPALILREAGGCAEHLNGSSYTVRSPDQITIVATKAAIAKEVRNWLVDRD